MSIFGEIAALIGAIAALVRAMTYLLQLRAERKSR